MAFEKRIPRRIFGPERDANGEWSRLHNEELNNLYRFVGLGGLGDNVLASGS